MCECSLSLLLFFFVLHFPLKIGSQDCELSVQTCKDEGIAVDTVDLLLWDGTSPPLSSNITINLIMTHLTRASPPLHLHFLLLVKVKLHVEAVVLEPTIKKKKKQPQDGIQARYISSAAELRVGRKK